MKFLKRVLTTTALALALMGGCAFNKGPGTNPETIVFDMHGRYATALQIAVAYKRLPSCDTKPAPLLCSKDSVIQDLQDADDIANPALAAAQTTVRAPGVGVNIDTMIRAAEEAVVAMTKITSKLQVQ